MGLFILSVPLSQHPRTITNFLLTNSFFFAITAGISGFYTYKVKKNPQAEYPWLKKSQQTYAPTSGGAHDLEASKDHVWDHNTQELDDVSDHSDDQHNRHDDDEYDDAHHTDEGIHPGRPVHWGPLGGPPGGPGAAHIPMPSVDTAYRGSTPSALSPNSLYVDSPQDRYAGPRTGGAGYSFSRPEEGR
jgi:hypothetical protein